jgi:hypothetical protein
MDRVIAVELNAFAAGSSASGTSRGMIAPREAELAPMPVDCRAVSASSSHGAVASNAAVTSSSSVEDHMSAEAPSSNTRRSSVSASAPPHRAKTTNGTRLATPSRPTHSDDCANAYICIGTATAVKARPMLDTAWPMNIRR